MPERLENFFYHFHWKMRDTYCILLPPQAFFINPAESYAASKVAQETGTHPNVFIHVTAKHSG